MKVVLTEGSTEHTFAVRFRYEAYPQKRKDGRDGTRRIVFGILEWQTSDGKWMALASSEANCSPEDNYSKRYGRLLAFRRILKKLNEPLSRFEMSVAEKFPNENVVVKFWEAFRATHRMPDEKKARLQVKTVNYEELRAFAEEHFTPEDFEGFEEYLRKERAERRSKEESVASSDDVPDSEPTVSETS